MEQWSQETLRGVTEEPETEALESEASTEKKHEEEQAENSDAAAENSDAAAAENDEAQWTVLQQPTQWDDQCIERWSQEIKTRLAYPEAQHMSTREAHDPD